MTALKNFILRDIWRIRLVSLPKHQAFLVRIFRIFLISAKEFLNDKCSLRASALTFYSLLSIVPVFAMAFGLAKGFGLDKTLKAKVLEGMQNQQEVTTRIIEFSENLLANTQGGVVAGIGLIFLFWTVIKVLGNIETSFNDIWGVKKQRTWSRKFSDYLSLMLICPIFIILASSVSVFITTQVTSITEKVAIIGVFGPLIFTCLKILPYAVFWGLLTYVYMFMPNTTVRFKSALIGGVVAGTLYQLVQWGYIYFQVGVSKAGAIYGSFAALPLFLIWLHISWLVVLYGAELAFAHQNESTFEFESDCYAVSPELKKLLSLRIAHICVMRFCDGLKPLTANEIAAFLDTPIRLTRELLHRLSETSVLKVVEGESEKDRGFQPARDVNQMTVYFVLNQLDQTGSTDIPVLASPELEQLQDAMQSFHQAAKSHPENALLKDISTVSHKRPQTQNKEKSSKGSEEKDG